MRLEPLGIWVKKLYFCLLPEGQEEVNLLLVVLVVGIISIFLHI